MPTSPPTRRQPPKSEPPDFSNCELGTLASSVGLAETTFLCPPYYVEGGINIDAGDGGVGKGLNASSIAACVTNGSEWPWSEDGEKAPLGNVIWCETEDPKEGVLIPRLIAAGADITRIRFMTYEEFQKVDRKFIRRNHVRLIVLSPFQSFLDVRNIGDDKQVREALEPLNEMVQGTRCAVIGLMHPNKKTDISSIHRLLGSQAFKNLTRSVVTLKPDGDGVRAMHLKFNWSEKGRDRLFAKKPLTVEEAQQRGLSEDEIDMLRAPRHQFWRATDWTYAEKDDDPNSAFDVPRSPGRPPNEREEAKQWLEHRLDDGHPHWADDVRIEASARGISSTTLGRARRDLRIKPYQHDRKWWWQLPK